MRRTALALLTIGFFAGCEQSPAPSTTPPGTNNTAARTAPASTAAEPPTTAPSGPRMKDTQATDAARLGTLPKEIGIPVGDRAPAATVRDANGDEVALADLIADGPTLVVFYRGGWCPFCNFQIRELTTAFPKFSERGVTPVTISVDQIEEAAKTRDNYTIPFPVLSDPDLAAHRAFRVMHKADDAEVEQLKGFGMDIEQSSGRDHHHFAIPSIFLIDKAGVVRWAHADLDYKVRPTIEQLLAAIDGANLGATAND